MLPKTRQIKDGKHVQYKKNRKSGGGIDAGVIAAGAIAAGAIGLGIAYGKSPPNNNNNNKYNFKSYQELSIQMKDIPHRM